MSIPATTVEIGFDLSALGDHFLFLMTLFKVF